MTCIQDEHSSHFFPITCEVKDLRPLLADVDTDVRPSYSQVGTTLIKHEGFHLKQKNKGMTFRSTEVRESGEQRNGCQDRLGVKQLHYPLHALLHLDPQTGCIWINLMFSKLISN